MGYLVRSLVLVMLLALVCLDMALERRQVARRRWHGLAQDRETGAGRPGGAGGAR